MAKLLSSLAVSAAAVVLAPGGSNFSWYQVDHPSPGVCNREPYGVVANFDRPDVREQVGQELAQMIASGQRRLRIGIFHGPGINTGTIMDSSGGDLSAQNRRNLADLLAAIREAGFAGVEIAFHPEGPSVHEWQSWRQDLFDQNWSLIRNLRPLIRAAGLPYRIDLANEGIPGPGEPLVLRYARTLWARYTRAFGRADAVGFSVIGDPAHTARIPEVYGGKPPYVFDLHFYDGTSGMTESQQFAASDALLRRRGLQQPWIIGEAFYDDGLAASRLAAAVRRTPRPIWWLTQWPLSRGSACADVDVPAPVGFGAYLAAGFGWTAGWAAHPRPTLASHRLAVDRAGRAAARIGCAGTVTRCSGSVALRSAASGTSPAKRFAVDPPLPAVVRITLGRAARNRLERGGRAAARLDVRVRSEDGAGTAHQSFEVTLSASAR